MRTLKVRNLYIILYRSFSLDRSSSLETFPSIEPHFLSTLHKSSFAQSLLSLLNHTLQ